MLLPPPPPTAAVAVIRSLNPEESFLVLRRAAHPLDPWSGHFSFPGGRKDRTDLDLFSTCLRETVEETGISLAPEHLEKILAPRPAGRQSPEPLWVQPYLFRLATRPSFSLNAREIRSGHWLPARLFLDHRRHRQAEVAPGRVSSVYPLGDYYLWGFTYRLLRSILFSSEE
jgi:8-oxo-dGTP pyrophosphatase MutT (NUDIX family)